MLFMFFFFKQKTAYEMRISDWRSDVCSSDLAPPARRGSAGHSQDWRARCPAHARRDGSLWDRSRAAALQASRAQSHGRTCRARARSEEHTSELQSLMRISYAVFCLKKKKKKTTEPKKRINLYNNKTVSTLL